MTEEYYVVKLKRPGGVTMADIEDYIEEAVSAWKGRLDPLDPMFNFKGESVSAKRLTKTRAERLFSEPAN